MTPFDRIVVSLLFALGAGMLVGGAIGWLLIIIDIFT
jgi:hypothetical protein